MDKGKNRIWLRVGDLLGLWLWVPEIKGKAKEDKEWRRQWRLDGLPRKLITRVRFELGFG